MFNRCESGDFGGICASFPQIVDISSVNPPNKALLKNRTGDRTNGVDFLEFYAFIAVSFPVWVDWRFYEKYDIIGRLDAKKRR